MNRRDALSRVALIMGGTIVGADYFLSGCKSPGKKVNELFTEDKVAFLNEVAETILPTTSTPGAKAAKVGQFMMVMVQDCYKPYNQKTFLDGMAQLDEASKSKYNGKFMDITAAQRTELLTDLDKEQKDFTKERNKTLDADRKKHKDEPFYEEPDIPNHYFLLMKELTLLGYFSSEIGATKALRYIAVPGHYDGNLPYKKGDKAWAT